MKAATAAQVKAWRKLKTRPERQVQGLFLVEGEHMVGEALAAGRVQHVLLDADKAERFSAFAASGAPCSALTATQLRQVVDSRTPQGVAALVALPPPPTLEQLGHRLVALDGVQDPGNVGTILRTMDAAGFTGLLTDTRTADAFSQKALSASMGSIFRVGVHVTQDLPGVLDSFSGFDIIAGHLQGEPFYQRPRTGERVCLLIGSEGAGLSPQVLSRATLRVRLPMQGGAESLNAAVAAAIMMYDLYRETLIPTLM